MGPWLGSFIEVVVPGSVDPGAVVVVEAAVESGVVVAAVEVLAVESDAVVVAVAAVVAVVEAVVVVAVAEPRCTSLILPLATSWACPCNLR
jgi:hypothetical protein